MKAGVTLKGKGSSLGGVDVQTGRKRDRVSVSIDIWTEGLAAFQIAHLTAEDAREVATALRIAADELDAAEGAAA